MRDVFNLIKKKSLETIVSIIFCAIIPISHTTITTFISKLEARTIVYITYGIIVAVLFLAFCCRDLLAKVKSLEAQQAAGKDKNKILVAQTCFPLGDTGFMTDTTGKPLCPHCLKENHKSYLIRDDENKRHFCRTCEQSYWDSDEARTRYCYGR